MSEAMDAEFDTMARWTAESALRLGAEFYVPAGCRGSGGPLTLDALLADLEVHAHSRMLDVGAGVGGPAGYAHHSTGVRAVLAEPQPQACRAAQRLFGLPTVQADAGALPFADRGFDVVWSLGVLCTTEQHRRILREIRRVLSPDGRAGLLVYVAVDDLGETPDGNHFPTPQQLRTDLAGAGLHTAIVREMAPAEQESARWRDHGAAVDADLKQYRHGHDAYELARAQAVRMGELLAGGRLLGQVVIARRA